MPYSKSKKRGCPTCEGIDPKSCMRCYGKSKIKDWHNTENGWSHVSELSESERKELIKKGVEENG